MEAFDRELPHFLGLLLHHSEKRKNRIGVFEVIEADQCNIVGDVVV